MLMEGVSAKLLGSLRNLMEPAKFTSSYCCMMSVLRQSLISVDKGDRKGAVGVDQEEMEEFFRVFLSKPKSYPIWLVLPLLSVYLSQVREWNMVAEVFYSCGSLKESIVKDFFYRFKC